MLKIMNFARNVTGDQAFIADTAQGQAAFNRPLNVRFGPDGCAWVTDYGAVRDNGADTHWVGVSTKWAAASDSGNWCHLADLPAMM